MPLTINFQGNYSIDPSKASPLCKFVAATDINDFAKMFDGKLKFNTEAQDIFEAIQQPYTLSIDEDKIPQEKFERLFNELDALNVKFVKEENPEPKLDIQG